MARSTSSENKELTGSGFEKRGGYASPKTPVATLPKVPAGPAPGASSSTAAPAQPTSGKDNSSR